MYRSHPRAEAMNRKSLKLYTLLLSGPQVRALHALVHDQQARRLTRTELRVIAELQAVRNKVQEDDERDL